MVALTWQQEVKQQSKNGQKKERTIYLRTFLQWEKYSVSAISRKQRCKQQAGKQYQVVVILWENDLNRKGTPRQMN